MGAVPRSAAVVRSASPSGVVRTSRCRRGSEIAYHGGNPGTLRCGATLQDKDRGPACRAAEWPEHAFGQADDGTAYKVRPEPVSNACKSRVADHRPRKHHAQTTAGPEACMGGLQKQNVALDPRSSLRELVARQGVGVSDGHREGWVCQNDVVRTLAGQVEAEQVGALHPFGSLVVERKVQPTQSHELRVDFDAVYLRSLFGCEGEEGAGATGGVEHAVAMVDPRQGDDEAGDGFWCEELPVFGFEYFWKEALVGETKEVDVGREGSGWKVDAAGDVGTVEPQRCGQVQCPAEVATNGCVCPTAGHSIRPQGAFGVGQPAVERVSVHGAGGPRSTRMKSATTRNGANKGSTYRG